MLIVIDNKSRKMLTLKSKRIFIQVVFKFTVYNLQYHGNDFIYIVCKHNLK